MNTIRATRRILSTVPTRPPPNLRLLHIDSQRPSTTVYRGRLLSPFSIQISHRSFYGEPVDAWAPYPENRGDRPSRRTGNMPWGTVTVPPCRSREPWRVILSYLMCLIADSFLTSLSSNFRLPTLGLTPHEFLVSIPTPSPAPNIDSNTTTYSRLSSS